MAKEYDFTDLPQLIKESNLFALPAIGLLAGGAADVMSALGGASDALREVGKSLTNAGGATARDALGAAPLPFLKEGGVVPAKPGDPARDPAGMKRAGSAPARAPAVRSAVAPAPDVPVAKPSAPRAAPMVEVDVDEAPDRRPRVHSMPRTPTTPSPSSLPRPPAKRKASSRRARNAGVDRGPGSEYERRQFDRSIHRRQQHWDRAIRATRRGR